MLLKLRDLLPVPILALAVANLSAQEPTTKPEPTVEQIVAAANRVGYYQGRDGRAQVEMEIVDAQGRKRVREMTILRRDLDDPNAAAKPAEAPKHDDNYCGEQRFYVRFRRPADVDNTTFLVWKKPGKATIRCRAALVITWALTWKTSPSPAQAPLMAAVTHQPTRSPVIARTIA